MNIIKARNLACPIDGDPLDSREKQLVCEHGHVFDVARQGYVNLLPVQHKRSKHPGDCKEMVSARTRFLGSGYYAPVANKLAEIISAQITGDEESCLLDAGCGEGYYLDTVFRYLGDSRRGNDISFIGLDISKPAITEAARRNKQITWLVGTNRQPPVTPGSVAIILCVFGFQSFDGFNKILKTGGKVILVEPGPDHLKELRAVIYNEVRKSGPPDIASAEAMGFSLLDTQQLQFSTGVIDREQINNLLVMTPHLYRATQAGRAAAAQLQELDLTVDVVFRILEKT
ncbi:MAG TPA: methyltransferase domain-containing protein [Gammaproteobacteria bacterium]|nr:methyltransferase domain-containing protein [Gammaproteobacteria bacterium]